MKKFFSEYRYWPQLAPLKSLPRAGEPERFLAFAKRDGVFDRCNVTTWGVVAAQSLMLTGRGIDYFIETPELAALIMGMVTPYPAAILDIFAETRFSALVIHPVTPRPAVLVGITTLSTGTLVVFHENGTGEKRASGFGPEAFRTKAKMEPQSDGERLAVGLALYISSYPHAVKDGIPDVAKHPSHYRGKKCATVGLVEELIDRRGPRPHLRNAHYRFLSSERYTTKRYTMVAVIGCFVVGRCRVVVEVEGN